VLRGSWRLVGARPVGIHSGQESFLHNHGSLVFGGRAQSYGERA